MDLTLEKLSKQELIALIKRDQETVFETQRLQQETQQLQYKVVCLEAQVEQYKRMLFGQKRERFEADSNQLPLPFAPSEEQVKKQEDELVEKIEYVRKKRPSAHKGRVALPAHLPVEEIEIYPQGDLSDMVCIGREVTEELECIPAKFFIRRYIRYKYAPKNKQGVVIGELPERVIEKGIPGPGLLAMIIVDKYMDHLPLYRLRQRFLRENIPIPSSTLEGWTRQGLEKIELLYDNLLEDTKHKGYLQVDETPIKVLESNKKGACHQGYYWVYHNPIDKTVLFDYQPTRAAKGPSGILKDFKGYLQTDGYGVYDKIGARAEVTHLACWAHARREFDKAKDNDKKRAEMALIFIQRLYAVEAEARENNLGAQARKNLRLEQSLPLLNAFGKWLAEEVKQVDPRSKIAKAMKYTMNRWDALSAYLYDGILEIDNNLVENAIRPVALGRKNYLFAGSHESAQRAAMIYSFFAICKKHEVNPYQWLKHTLENIMSINHKNIKDLYPQNFKNNM